MTHCADKPLTAEASKEEGDDGVSANTTSCILLWRTKQEEKTESRGVCGPSFTSMVGTCTLSAPHGCNETSARGDLFFSCDSSRFPTSGKVKCCSNNSFSHKRICQHSLAR